MGLEKSTISSMMLKSLLMIANDTSNNGLHVGKVKVLPLDVFSDLVQEDRD